MRLIRERHLHERATGLYCLHATRAFDMNKIILEHFPIDKLPEELRLKATGWHSLTLTMEEKGPAAFTRDDLLALKGKPAGPSVNTIEGIRALRDEWA